MAPTSHINGSTNKHSLKSTYIIGGGVMRYNMDIIFAEPIALSSDLIRVIHVISFPHGEGDAKQS